VAWERRGDGFYYYQTEREDGQVRKKYVGRGEIAELVAHADETLRRSRAERRERERAALEEARSLASVADGLHEAAKVLARAHLIAAGYRRHKGEYRRARD
jgi:hypothetical protein